MSPTTSRGRGRRIVALCAAVILVMTASLGAYEASRLHTGQPSDPFGVDQHDPDRVEATAWITKVDVASQTMTVLLVDVIPHGSLALKDDDFAEDVVLETNSVINDRNAMHRGEAFSSVECRFSLAGTPTDFPFDRYSSAWSLRMTRADGSVVPLAVTVVSTDAFFSTTPYYDADQDEWLNVDVGMHRSIPTIVFGVFVMALMLGLAAAAALAAYFIVRSRQGLVFGAYSVMAALLFAMIPLRNAVPGSPPIGSVIDYAAFFIAEAVIAISLITSVIVGYRHQHELDESKR